MTRHATLPLWDDQNTEERMQQVKLWIDDLYNYTFRIARDHVRTILKLHTATDAKESKDVASILQLIEREPKIFSPMCEVGHFTGSALVLDTNGRVLLHYHKSLKRWLQFGGHPDFETNMAAVALREAQEESGLEDLTFFPETQEPRPLDIDVHTIPAIKNRPEHLHLDFRYVLMTQTPEALHPQSGESTDFRWFSFDEIDPQSLGLDPALFRLMNKAKVLFQEQQQ